MSCQTTLRELAVEYDNLTRPDGSAVFTQGDSVVQCAVYGPSEVKQNKELPNKSLVEVIYRPKTGIPGCAEKLQERFIKNTLECVILTTLHPRTAITVIVQELHNAGSLLSCCINAAMLALLDSGLSLKCTIAAVDAVVTQAGDIVVDPTTKDEQKGRACLSLAFDSIERKLIAITGHGSYTEAQAFSCQKACRTASEQIFTFYRDSVNRRCSKDVQQTR